MSEPVQITIGDVRVGDTVRITRMFDDVSMAWEGPVFEVKPEVRIGRCGAYHIDAMTGSNVAIHLIHRPPTRRAITIDDLKDWRAVPIGTRIELATEPFGKARAGKLTVRRETSESDEGWEFEVGGCWVQFSSIKPGALFIIEEAKP